VISAYLAAEEISPALVVCSTARRARETCDGLRAAFDPRAEVRFERWLYDADPDDILRRLREVAPAIESMMVIGHNPDVQELAITVAGDGDPAALAQLDAKFPTAALAVLDLRELTWDQLEPGTAYLRAVVLPRQLEARGQ
jgi:phosphohistidine phosphatase